MPQLWRAIHIYCCLILSDTLPRKYKLKNPLAMKIVRSTFSDCADSFHSTVYLHTKTGKICTTLAWIIVLCIYKMTGQTYQTIPLTALCKSVSSVKKLRVYKVKVFEVQVRELLLIWSLPFYCWCLVGPHTDQVNLEPRLTFVCVIRRFCSWKDRFNE